VVFGWPYPLRRVNSAQGSDFQASHKVREMRFVIVSRLLSIRKLSRLVGVTSPYHSLTLNPGCECNRLIATVEFRFARDRTIEKRSRPHGSEDVATASTTNRALWPSPRAGVRQIVLPTVAQDDIAVRAWGWNNPTNKESSWAAWE
jgi:hypothetical protein